eukprot:Platyproteum_vivax@DN5808_c0_g1_i1.p1
MTSVESEAFLWGKRLAVKPASEKQLDQLHDLETAGFPASEAASKEQMLYRLQMAPALYYCLSTESATDDDGKVVTQGEVVSYINATASLSELDESTMETHVKEGANLCIHSVVVDHKWRRQGIALAFLQTYLRIVLNQHPSVEKVSLLSHAYMLALYSKCGFSVDGLWEHVHGPDPWILMSLNPNIYRGIPFYTYSLLPPFKAVNGGTCLPNFHLVSPVSVVLSAVSCQPILRWETPTVYLQWMKSPDSVYNYFFSIFYPDPAGPQDLGRLLPAAVSSVVTPVAYLMAAAAGMYQRVPMQCPITFHTSNNIYYTTRLIRCGEFWAAEPHEELEGRNCSLRLNQTKNHNNLYVVVEVPTTEPNNEINNLNERKRFELTEVLYWLESRSSAQDDVHFVAKTGSFLVVEIKTGIIEDFGLMVKELRAQEKVTLTGIIVTEREVIDAHVQRIIPHFLWTVDEYIQAAALCQITTLYSTLYEKYIVTRHQQFEVAGKKVTDKTSQLFGSFRLLTEGNLYRDM